jgi:hypothetical protein
VQAAFDHSNSDIVNGYGDAVGVKGLAGHDYTFNERDRKKAECFAKCMGNKALNDFIDTTAGQYMGPLSPFVDVGTDGVGFENPLNDSLGTISDTAAGIYGTARFPRKWIGRSAFAEILERGGAYLMHGQVAAPFKTYMMRASAVVE